jgi:hypothetical protein
MSQLMPHQEKALKEMHNGCILKGILGSGKTMTSLAYYVSKEFPKRLIVITPAKKKEAGDWQAEARQFGLFPEVSSWHSLGKYEDVRDAFFIFDEQRVVGSGPWVRAFSKITRHNSWILLSATPGDSWMDYIPVFLANGFYRNRTEFLDEHVVFHPFMKYPKVIRYNDEQKLQRLLNSILVDMSYERHTVRHVIPLYCEYDRENYDIAWRNRWNYLENRPIRQVSELFSLIRRTVNSDPSRLGHILSLLEKHPRLIVFYNFDYELEILRTLDTSVAEWNGHKHEKIPGSSEWAYLVQYQAGAEGWNCIQTNAMAFWSQTYSYRNFEQAKGRIDRLDTPYTDLYYYVLKSSSGIDNGIATNLSQKKNFNEARWLKNAA